MACCYHDDSTNNGKKGGKSNNTILHETGHFLGLSDRSANYTGFMNKNVTENLPGWDGDIMTYGNGKKNFSNKHYQTFLMGVPKKNYIILPGGFKLTMANVTMDGPTFNSKMRYNNDRILDVNSRGYLIHNIKDPYEINKAGQVINIKFSKDEN